MIITIFLSRDTPLHRETPRRKKVVYDTRHDTQNDTPNTLSWPFRLLQRDIQPAGENVVAWRRASTEKLKYSAYVILVSLKNDNMVSYSFTTDQGWRVTEHRPFSASYAVLYSPCMPGWDYTDFNSQPESDKAPDNASGSENMLAMLTSQQLRFNYFSKDVLRQLLMERVAIRDHNRSAILGRLGDVSGEIYGVSHLYTLSAEKQKQNLEKTRLDLERQLREEDVTLWRDSLELRRELILADKTYAGTRFRQGLMKATPSLDDHKGQEHTIIPE